MTVHTCTVRKIAPMIKNASEARHQADNLAKLRHEYLSVFELIAQILGAVSGAKI